jgi:hypothetical protein
MAKKKNQTKIKQVIRAAGPTISKGEMNKIVKAAGGDTAKALNRISSVQESMKENDKRAPSIGSGAANRLIEQASTPIGRSSLGNSSVAQAILSMAGRPAGPMRQGQQTPAIPGTRITPGMVLRPSGREGTRKSQPKTVTQFVESQYTGPTQEEIDAQIAAGVQQGIDDYLAGIGGDNSADQAYLDLLSGIGNMFSTQMGAYQQQMAGQMDLLNQFAMPQYQEPMRLYGAGQNYNIDAVRAAQRNQQRRSGYLRGMGISGGTSGAPALSSGMSIGSALATPGGVTI